MSQTKPHLTLLDCISHCVLNEVYSVKYMFKVNLQFHLVDLKAGMFRQIISCSAVLTPPRYTSGIPLVRRYAIFITSTEYIYD